MKLFKIELTAGGYDSYDSCVLAAESLEQVKGFCDKNFSYHDEYGMWEYCCKGCRFQINFDQKVDSIIEIGTTDKYTEPEIIVSSYNAG